MVPRNTAEIPAREPKIEAVVQHFTSFISYIRFKIVVHILSRFIFLDYQLKSRKSSAFQSLAIPVTQTVVGQLDKIILATDENVVWNICKLEEASSILVYIHTC